jgi:hypothetical protein
MTRYERIYQIGGKIGESEIYGDTSEIKRQKTSAKTWMMGEKNEAELEMCRGLYTKGVRDGRTETRRLQEAHRLQVSNDLLSYNRGGGGGR